MATGPGVNIVFTSTDESTCGLYFKHFREVPGIKVRQINVLDGEECLVLPLPSCFGLYGTKSGFVNGVMKVLGPQVAEMIREHVLHKYLGEQPVGSAFMLKNPNTSSKFKFILVVAVFRALTCKGDDMAWLDPNHVHQDFCYNAMRGCLLRLLKHNATSKTKITTIYCPDFFQLKKEGPGGEIGPHEADDAVKQILLACRSILEPSKELKDWPSAILLTSQIIQTKQEDIEELLASGALEARGIYTKEELDTVMGWCRDSKDLVKQETALKVLAACLHRRDTQFNLPKRDIARMISSQKEGCLPMMLTKVLQQKLTIHTELLIEELHLGKKLGVGAAGVVMRGMWQDKPVAIKEFTKEVAKEDMLKELSIMCLVQHPNLVKCYGGITQSKMLIVQELMQCNLADVLAEASIKIDLGSVCSIAVQAAQGIEFLHSHCNLIHRDLKSPNILITSRDHLEAKITDFGASRVLNRRSSMTGNVGTVAWIAPEVFGQRKYNEKCDVYSFGIILWELLSRQIPFANMSSFAIPMSVMKGERPPLKKEYPSGFQKLIKECWHAKPHKRPSFQQVIIQVKRLHSNLRAVDKLQTNLDLQKLFPMPTNQPSTLEQMASILPKNEDGDSMGSSATPSEESSGSENDQILTCSLPPKWNKTISRYESKFNTEMSTMGHDLEQGKIATQSSRFILVRANSIFKDFSTFAQKQLIFEGDLTAEQFSRHFLHGLGVSIGRQAAQKYFMSTLTSEKTTRIAMGFVHMAYAGFSFVTLMEKSDLAKNLIITQHSVSFEADSWQDIPVKSALPVCHMCSGYVAGWSQESVGEPMASVEVTCRGCGDAQCVFITCPQSQLEANVVAYCEENNISLDVTKALVQVRSGGATWLDVSKVKINTTPEPLHSPVNVFEEIQLSPEEIDVKVDSSLQNFYLDPSSATIELANQRCLMLQQGALAKGLYLFLSSTLESQVKKDSFSMGASLAYFLGKSFGLANATNFCEQLKIGANAISRALAISANLAYNGWGSFRILKGLDESELVKNDFLLVCAVQHSFEAETWVTKAAEPDPVLTRSSSTKKRRSSHPGSVLTSSASEEQSLTGIRPPCVCAMHCGYISGWFEEGLKKKCCVVEVRCVSSGARRCEFYVAHPDSIKKFVANFDATDHGDGFKLVEAFGQF